MVAVLFLLPARKVSASNPKCCLPSECAAVSFMCPAPVEIWGPQIWPIKFIQIRFGASVLLWNTHLSQTHFHRRSWKEPVPGHTVCSHYAASVSHFYPVQGNLQISVLWWRPYSTQRTIFPLVIQWWNCSLQGKNVTFPLCETRKSFLRPLFNLLVEIFVLFMYWLCLIAVSEHFFSII